MRKFVSSFVTVFVLLSGFLALIFSSAQALSAADAQRVPTKSEVTEADQFWTDARKEVDQTIKDTLALWKSDLVTRPFVRGDATKEIALTFDDGPHPKFTPQLLEVLRENHVNATFFLVGEMAEKCPILVRDEVADGHQIGNHTYHHVNLNTVPITDLATEILACGKVLEDITDRKPTTFRPPGGDYDSIVTSTVASLGYTTVLWTDNPGDYSKPGAAIITQRLLSRVRGGSVILLHDGIQQSVDALPKIIKTLKQQGYRFVTVDQLMRDSHWPTMTRKPVGPIATKPNKKA